MTEETAFGKAFDARLLWRVWEFTRPHKRLFFLALILIPLGAGVEVVSPLLLKTAVDRFTGHAPGPLGSIALLFGAALLFRLILGFADTYLLQRLGALVTNDIRRALFVRVQRMPLRYFDRTPLGRLMTRLLGDTDAVSELFASGAVTLLDDFVRLGAIVIAMLLLDWKMALATFAAALPFLALSLSLRHGAREAFRDIRTKVARLTAYLHENLAGMPTVQLFVREVKNRAEFDRLNADHMAANARAIRIDAILYSGAEAVGAICMATILWWVAPSLATGVTSFGLLVAFVEYVQRFFGPIRDLSSKFTVMQAGMASAERIAQLLDEPEEQDAPGAVPAATLRRGVELRDVHFSYREGHEVLRGMGFAIERGERVALVGATGSGKTTVARLLTRLYDLGPEDRGLVLIDGADARALQRQSVRKRFAVVLQEPYLFAGTVAENVTLADAGISRAAVTAALARVGATRVVERLGGLDARVSERGANLSAGERQLVSFARALVRPHDVLLLDEATSAVDPATEALLQKGVEELLLGGTALIIAHRLSTVEHCDRIVVLHRGKVVEEGRHQDLLARGGYYARLHALQLAKGPLTAAV